MKKLNMTIGRFQPMTVGHNNMIIEGDAPCIVYRINSSNKIPDNIKGWKVDGRVVKKDAIQHVINYLNDGGKGELTEQEKELLKRPFTNELIDKELQIVKKSNKNIIDVIPVVNMFDALMKFNKFITDHANEYEPQYLMCGDDRADAYKENIDKYDELDDDWNSGKKIPNVLKGVLKVNTGKGRIEGISGTAVRKAIITKDKDAFEKIMPKGVGSMFNDFINAFDEFKDKLQGLIKECKMMTLKEYIIERLHINKDTKFIEPQQKIRIGSDNLYKTGLKYKTKHYTYDKNNFIEEFSKAWYPGEGENMGAYYIVNFCDKNYNVRIFKAGITREHGKNSHFQIAWLPMDSKSRSVFPEEPTEEITEYYTNGGFHGNENDIIWVGNKIKSRKDFAEIVYNYIKSIFEK